MKRVASEMSFNLNENANDAIDFPLTKKGCPSLEDLLSFSDIKLLSDENCIMHNSPSCSVSENSTFMKLSINFNRHFIIQQELGNRFLLRAELFKNDVKIHIREFFEGANHELFPTKNGICLNLETWYNFCKKISNFNLIYQESGFVSNNILLTLNVDGEMILQRMDTLQRISLNEFQLNAIKENLQNFNEELLLFLYERYLPALIVSNSSINEQCDETDQQIELINLMEEQLSTNIFKKVFYCNGCVFNESGQKHHDCLNVRDLYKFEQLGNYILLLIDFNQLVKNFCKNQTHVSNEFLCNIYVKTLNDVLFKTSIDVSK